MLLEEKDLTANSIYAMVESLIYDDKKLSDMSLAAQSLGFPNAAEDLVKLIKQVLGENV
ncbi:MAG: hypothetical protein IJO78_01300 [Erysipelotrichaceae bacterium]|nr:hypothetical protein [Erysipelotrichaceae bacterium]